MTQNKIQVEICIGTPCFLMGGQNLIEELEWLPFKYKSNFTFKASQCIDQHCKNAPIIRVNNKIFENVSLEKFKDILEQHLVQEEI